MLRSSVKRLRLAGFPVDDPAGIGEVLGFHYPSYDLHSTPIGIAAKNDGVRKGDRGPSRNRRPLGRGRSSAWVETDAVALTLTKDEAEA